MSTACRIRFWSAEQAGYLQCDRVTIANVRPVTDASEWPSREAAREWLFRKFIAVIVDAPVLIATTPTVYIEDVIA